MREIRQKYLLPNVCFEGFSFSFSPIEPVLAYLRDDFCIHHWCFVLCQRFLHLKKKHPQSFQVCYIKQAWLHQEVPQSLMSSSGWCSQSWPSSWYPSFCARTDVCEVLTLLQFILQHLCWRRNSSLQDLSLTPSPWSPSVFCCVSFSPSPVSYSSMSRYSGCNLKVFFWRWALNSWKTTQDSLCWEGSMGWRMDLILLLSENIIS